MHGDLPGRGEREGGHLAVDAVTVALEEGAQVGEGAFLQVDAVGPVPRHHLSAERRANVTEGTLDGRWTRSRGHQETGR